MRRAVPLLVLVVLAAACGGGSHKAITTKDCPGSVTIIDARELHMWTQITTGDTWPSVDARVWHEGKPPKC